MILPVAVATLVALIWMWPAAPKASGEAPLEVTRLTGTITAVGLTPCPAAVNAEGVPLDVRDAGAVQAEPDPRRCGKARVKLADGQVVTVELPSGPGSQVFADGDDVVVVHAPGGPGGDYQLSDHDRSDPLWLVAAAFVLAVVAFGRWRGLTALLGLAITFALLLFFLIPAILEGRPPLLAAIVCAAAIMVSVLYLTHGFHLTISLAVIGTLASLALTGALALAALKLTHLTGITDEASFYLDFSYQINTQGLLLASIIIGSLGVLDDVTVTQAATVDELAAADPGYTFAQLYRAAARVGRAHIASVINTIVLAYAGAALPLLLLFRIGGRPVDEVLTNPNVAQEIVRSVAGTIGLICAVPLTTALAAFVAARRDRADAPPAEGEPRRRRPEELPDPLTDRPYF